MCVFVCEGLSDLTVTFASLTVKSLTFGFEFYDKISQICVRRKNELKKIQSFTF